MIVISKRDADNILIDSLFDPIDGKTLTIKVFCTGKYWKTPSNMVKQKMEVADLPDCRAVFGVRKRDKNGQYTKLMYLSTE